MERQRIYFSLRRLIILNNRRSLPFLLLKTILIQRFPHERVLLYKLILVLLSLLELQLLIIALEYLSLRISLTYLVVMALNLCPVLFKWSISFFLLESDWRAPLESLMGESCLDGWVLSRDKRWNSLARV